jgi:protein O-GlcNAc transferase
MDVALDAFPYNGGTTTMEALWQGVPVLTFDGDRWAARTSTTLLRRTHLADMVSGSKAEMVAGAITLGRDPDTPARLQSLRQGMRDRLLAAPVCDAPALARAMEDLYARLTA